VNLLVIHTDQQRWDSLGCYGNEFARTPAIDALAAEGRRYARHFSSNPVCMPSRASLLSGRYPSGHGVWSNGIPLPREEFVISNDHAEHWQRAMKLRHPHVRTLADYLQDAGYRTHSVGKQHLTPTESSPEYRLPESRFLWEGEQRREWTGPYCGFQSLDLSLHHGENVTGHYRYWFEDSYPAVAGAIDRGERPETDAFPPLQGAPGDLRPSLVPLEAHHSTWCGDRAVDFLDSVHQSDAPFFLWVGFPDPHHPWTPPLDLAAEFAGTGSQPSTVADARPDSPGLRSMFGGGNDLLSTTGTADDRTGGDRAARIAPVIARLREFTNAQIHLIDRAVGRIVEKLRAIGKYDDTVIVFTSDHGDFLGDYGLIRKSGVPHSALTRTSLIIRVPGDERSSVIERPVSNTDVLPTLLELLGVRSPDDPVGARRDEFDGVSVAGGVPDDHLALVQCFGGRESRSLSVMDDRYRLTWYPATGEREIYDHSVDPYELLNLAGAPDVSDDEVRLMERLREEHLRVVSPISGHLSPW
jgi:arylsulfatase A-like enzyme